MVDLANQGTGPDPRTTPDSSARIASLRYHDPLGAFAATLQPLGLALPQPLRCVVTGSAAGSIDVLAWRSPTETIWICDSTPRFDALRRALPAMDEGCLVDQTHGRRLIRLRGAAGPSLAQLGSGFTEIGVGAVRIGRMADIVVLACRPSAEEWLLIVDRLYLEHFIGYLNNVTPSETNI
jgi:heterotetrameric sarcosine oxidase gamma subunit